MYNNGLPTEEQKTPLTYTQYKGVSEATKPGRVSATNRIVTGRQRMESIEASFMNVAYKAGRSDRQRDERRSKRK